MSKFAYLNKLKAKADATAEFPIPELNCTIKKQDEKTGEIKEVRKFEPVLIVMPTTESNKDYTKYLRDKARGIAAKQVRRRGRQTSPASVTDQQLEDSRLEALDALAKYAVTGWRDIYNEHGEDEPFTTEECAAFTKRAASEYH